MTTKTFPDLGIDARIADALADRGIVTPFPIQEIAIPVALQGADVIGQARTGTGKTLGFGLPLIQRLDPDHDRTQALVVVPTRELCIQVADDLELGELLGLRVIAIYGGVGYDHQIEALRGGTEIVVGTPGRLLDHLQRGNLDLSGVTELVLDEADEMLDMGFLPDVERLIEACAGERHTMLFSATMPTPVVKLARRYMHRPTFLRADTEEHETAPTVDQHFFLVHRMDKPRVLARILQAPEAGNCYVFVRTKRMADRLVNELEALGVDSIAIHGDLRQTTRERNLDRFRDGSVNVLVATEVAARGLDVHNVTHVVNYDCPDDEKMYLHRIGRTARAGAEGVAVTFAEFNEVDRVNVIRKAVDADRELEEVFSTSDLLTERFDLPAETPWAHLARSSRGSERRRGTSDGKPKNREVRPDRERSQRRPAGERTGAGRRAPAGSDERASGSERGGDRRPDGDAAPAPSGPRRREGRRRADTAGSSPARTRRRTRTRVADGGDGPGAASAGPSASERSTPADPAPTGSGVTSGGSARPAPRSSDQPSGSGTTAAGGSGRSARPSASRSRPRARPSRSGEGLESGRDGQEGEGRGGRDRSGPPTTERRDHRTRSEDDQHAGAPTHAQAGDRRTRRGTDARGGGQPQLARRVRVEHLP